MTILFDENVLRSRTEPPKVTHFTSEEEAGKIMPGFKFVFFLAVELPSMMVMTAHKMICTIRDEPCTPLPIWQYRLIGFAGLCAAFFVAMIIFALSGAGQPR
ncbi:hypothetical protein [Nonomuraea sp. NPDC050783]|uniref:hypothetical protein n=1 Tax=Nonomuraea sp. NPDC050783 TaxID=3154634 RepID=UPI0034658102